MAAGIGDPVTRRDGRALLSAQLRKAVGPAVRSAVRRGGVDDAHIRVVDQRNSFPRTVIRQAQEYDVRRVEEFAPLIRIMALVLVDPHQFQVLPRSDPVKNLKAGRSCLSVYVNFGSAHFVFLVFVFLIFGLAFADAYHNTVAGTWKIFFLMHGLTAAEGS